jgi:hypothetical protein
MVRVYARVARRKIARRFGETGRRLSVGILDRDRRGRNVDRFVFSRLSGNN